MGGAEGVIRLDCPIPPRLSPHADDAGEWLAGWIRSGRLETEDALKNQDLWQQLAVLSARHEVRWEWVRGHDGHHFNERCDRLAKRAAEAGMRAAGALEETVNNLPLPEIPAGPALLPIGEDKIYEADEEGQLLLC